MFCEAKGQQEQWRRVSSTRHRHWLRVNPRAAAQNAGKAGVSHSFFPSSCPRQCDLQNTQKRNRQSILVFLYFVFISASLSLFLRFGSAPLYRSVLFLLFLLFCFRWSAV
jgi:hypothetical protein